MGWGSTNYTSAWMVARKLVMFTPARVNARWSFGRRKTASSSAKVSGLMTGMSRRCRTAWMIRAGGPAADNRPDTKILVSRTTRTLAPNRCHLSGNLFRSDA